MAIPNDIRDFVVNHIEMMISQSHSYMPFIKDALPNSKNVAEATFSLIAGYALSVFVNQYAMRLQNPNKEDFEEFGNIISKYQERIEKLF